MWVLLKQIPIHAHISKAMALSREAYTVRIFLSPTSAQSQNPIEYIALADRTKRRVGNVGEDTLNKHFRYLLKCCTLTARTKGTPSIPITVRAAPAGLASGQ